MLSPEQQQHQQAMRAYLKQILQPDGLPFEAYMEQVLYAPRLGYYSGGATKLGAAGDFITAPELSPYFSRCLAHYCAQHLQADMDLLEFGAGSGIMAADMMLQLDALDRLPAHYYILELSPELKQRQQQLLQQKIPHLYHRFIWLNALPSRFKGLMLANEVLDAMPVAVFQQTESELLEQWVIWQDGLKTIWQPARPELQAALSDLSLPAGYLSEINLRLGAWLASLADSLQQGQIILIDYGYDHDEYYHPQRCMGTLICHYRHQAHDDPLHLPGLQDITASVDFGAVAQQAQQYGLKCLLYQTQAHFLIANGLDKWMQELDPMHSAQDFDALQKIKQLILPQAMGERFKVMILGQ